MEVTLNSAKSDFEQQLKADGWAGDFADWISRVWASDNRAEFVEEEIEEFDKQIQELKSAASEGDFKAKFKEIFGVEYNPVLIKAFENKQQEYTVANAVYIYEQQFNRRCHDLISEKTLAEVGVSHADGSYDTIKTKEQVYNENFFIDLGKYYVIMPSVSYMHTREEFIKHHNAKLVPQGFHYRSDLNTEWETVESMRENIRKYVDPNFKVK